jgi:hypothetical protein
MDTHDLTLRDGHGHATRRAALGLAPGVARRCAFAVTLSALLALWAWQAQAQEATEAVLKGAFVYNFTKFTEWPEDVLESGAPLVVCVVGDPAVADALTRNAKDRQIGGHPVAVEMRTENGVQACHVLYVSSASARTVAQALASVASAPVLTISDDEAFANTGGIAQLFVAGGKMRFRVNLALVRRSRLQLSSRLLSLAELVHD